MVCVCICVFVCVLFLWSLKGYIECCIGVLIYIHSIHLKRSHNFFFLVAFSVTRCTGEIFGNGVLLSVRC